MDSPGRVWRSESSEVRCCSSPCVGTDSFESRKGFLCGSSQSIFFRELNWFSKASSLVWESPILLGTRVLLGHFLVHFTLVVTFAFSCTNRFYSLFLISLQFVQQFQICRVWADAFECLCFVPSTGTDPVLIHIFLKLPKTAGKRWKKSKIITFTEVIETQS